MKVYYAHAIALFKSKQEQLEIAQIQAAFKDAEIVNPGDQKFMWQKAKGDIDFFMGLVDQSDTVVYSLLLGEITFGVGAEVNRALEKGKIVYHLSDGALLRVVTSVTAISRDATRVLYHKWWESNQ